MSEVYSRLSVTPPDVLEPVGLDDDDESPKKDDDLKKEDESTPKKERKGLKIQPPDPGGAEDDDYLGMVTPGSPPPVSGLGFSLGSRLVSGRLDEKTGTYNAIFSQPESSVPPQRATSQSKVNLQGILDARPSKSMNIPEFVYNHDFDESGILHYLGTNRWTQKNWVNPAISGVLQLSSSEMNPDSQPLHSFIGRTACRALLANIPNSWFMIDFKDHVIVPRHYTLRHYSSQDSHALRHWRLEGSNDGQTWDILRIHKNDKSLSKKGMAHTWSLDTYSITKHKSKAYRLFKIQMTGENSSDYFRNLCCSGFELYGFLFELQQIEIDEDDPEEIWVETNTPVGERKGEIFFNEEEIEIGQNMTKDEKGLEFFQSELFKNEKLLDKKDRSIEIKRLPEKENRDLLAAQVAETITSRLGQNALGVRFINDPVPPEISDDKLRELLNKQPGKPILRDPLKGYKKNRRNILFADESQTVEQDPEHGPKLVTVVLLDADYLHHGKTRGRKCPNAARRDQEFVGDNVMNSDQAD